MPVPDYGVLKGRPTGREVKGPAGKPPHLHIILTAGGGHFDAAVNILSTDGSEILYHVDHAFSPAQAAGFLALPAGRTLLPAGNPLALDYVRQGVVAREDMMLLTAHDAEHLTDSDLHNEIDDLVVRAMHDPQAQLFVFGSKFPQGIHDVHFNQGNTAGQHPDFSGDNGTFQDGALMAFFPDEQRWIGAFIAFQSQSWATNDKGYPA